ncbi:MAG: hypothetical protein VX527_00205 [Planctomycetota bacterium]|nr:hypothetical protein [Planctomycetota bacterium]
MMTTLFGLVATLIAIGVFVLGVIFILVPIVKGGFAVGSMIGRLIHHICRWLFGSISDVIRIVGQLFGIVILIPTLLGSVVLGRWSAAQQAWSVIKGNTSAIVQAFYSLAVRRPMALLGIGAALDEVERSFRDGAIPTNIDPSIRFEGYQVIDTLTSGGSGAALFVAEPLQARRRRLSGQPSRVVIKCFDLDAGSMLPQMMRESRSLDAARRLGLVLEHDMDPSRFWYVMPWIPGVHLGEVVRELHAGDRGLDPAGLSKAIDLTIDLLQTLRRYHRQGLWHKDVKPENIIVNESGAHLVDLGLVTPLASAMTLTTHGTEYFRDPELVRQALRGVKVSEVDGARFDVYAAGAVLYYILENTFPAHGGLSRFDQPSPEAAKWIVHRAMSDYEQRYSEVGVMREDVAVLANASDPWSVRPADLPSMRGVAATESIEGMPPPPPAPIRRHSVRPMAPPPPLIPTRKSSPGSQFTWIAAAASFVLGVGILILVGQVLISPSENSLDTYGESRAIADQVEVPSPASSRPGLCLLIVDHASRDTDTIAESIDAFRGQLSRAGWSQRVDVEAEIAIRSVMSPQPEVGRAPVHPAVRRALEDRDLDAAVLVIESSREASGIDVIMLTHEWQARWEIPPQPEHISGSVETQE